MTRMMRVSSGIDDHDYFGYHQSVTTTMNDSNNNKTICCYSDENRCTSELNQAFCSSLALLRTPTPIDEQLAKLRHEFYGLVSPIISPSCRSSSTSPAVSSSSLLEPFRCNSAMADAAISSQSTPFRACPITRARKRAFNFSPATAQLIDAALCEENDRVINKKCRNNNQPAFCDSLIFRLKSLPEEIRTETWLAVEQLVSQAEAKNAKEQVAKIAKLSLNL